jgi:hypothetical protein
VADVVEDRQRRRNRLRHHRELAVCGVGGAGIQPAGTSTTGCLALCAIPSAAPAKGVTPRGRPALSLCVTLPLAATVASPAAILLSILAVWRVTHLLWGEDGPGDIVVRVRRLAGDGFFGRVLDCFYCLSLWVAIPFAAVVGGGWPERVIAWFGLSGGAILLERLTTREALESPPPTQRREDRDVMLR